MDVLAFLGICLLVIVTPGQDTALTIQNTLLGGRRAGAFTALGVSAGQKVWTLAASASVFETTVCRKPGPDLDARPSRAGSRAGARPTRPRRRGRRMTEQGASEILGLSRCPKRLVTFRTN